MPGAQSQVGHLGSGMGSWVAGLGSGVSGLMPSGSAILGRGGNSKNFKDQTEASAHMGDESRGS